MITLSLAEITGTADVNHLIFAVRHVSHLIITSIPSWNSYQYDDSEKQSINDGGGDIFDTGNQVMQDFRRNVWPSR